MLYKRNLLLSIISAQYLKDRFLLLQSFFSVTIFLVFYFPLIYLSCSCKEEEKRDERKICQFFFLKVLVKGGVRNRLKLILRLFWGTFLSIFSMFLLLFSKINRGDYIIFDPK